MNIFNTPDWESNSMGDASAMQLFGKNAKLKTFKKQKIKKKKSFPKGETIVENRKTTEHRKTFNNNNTRSNGNIKKIISPVSTADKLPRKKTKVSNTRDINTKFIEKNIKVGVHYGGNKKDSSKAGTKADYQIKRNEMSEKVSKKKIARLKKRNKQKQNIEHSTTKNSVLRAKELNKKKSTNVENKKNLIKAIVHDDQMDNVRTLSKAQTKKLNLINKLSSTPTITEKKKKVMTLRERMMEKLKASRFRYINEQIYNSESREAQKFFKSDPDAFYAYHDGYRQQVTKWPLNPLDVIIKSIKKMPLDYIIADFGCGDAHLSMSVSQKVHSFDFVPLNEHVTSCDMAHVPLQNESVNVVVFCLSLMGNNIREYLYEANRVLISGGKLKIAEVESRFDTVDVFIEGVKKFGFAIKWKDLSHNLFYFLDFEKISKCKPLNKLPTIGLHPCLYKKR